MCLYNVTFDHIKLLQKTPLHRRAFNRCAYGLVRPPLAFISCDHAMAYSNTTEDKDNYGFDCNFVSEPPPELLCPICVMVLRDPYQSLCCGGHYCQCCVQQLVEKNMPCTLCGGKVEIFRDVNVTLKVNSLQVKCSNSDWGCEWEGELGHLGEHLVKCEQKPAMCGMCGYFVPSGTFRDHESLHCPLRTYTCTHCNKFTATYDEVCHKHWPVCPCYPVSCPNECSKQKIPRNKLLHHLYKKCDLKQRVCDMTETIEHLQLDLQEEKLRIRELEAEAGNVEVRGIIIHCQFVRNHTLNSSPI